MKHINKNEYLLEIAGKTDAQKQGVFMYARAGHVVVTLPPALPTLHHYSVLQWEAGRVKVVHPRYLGHAYIDTGESVREVTLPELTAEAHERQRRLDSERVRDGQQRLDSYDEAILEEYAESNISFAEQWRDVTTVTIASLFANQADIRAAGMVGALHDGTKIIPVAASDVVGKVTCVQLKRNSFMPEHSVPFRMDATVRLVDTNVTFKIDRVSSSWFHYPQYRVQTLFSGSTLATTIQYYHKSNPNFTGHAKQTVHNAGLSVMQTRQLANIMLAGTDAMIEWEKRLNDLGQN